NLANPQSLNRYAYALNNPETMIDPSGLGPLRYVPPGTNNWDEFNFTWGYDDEGQLWISTTPLPSLGGPGGQAGPGGGGGSGTASGPSETGPGSAFRNALGLLPVGCSGSARVLQGNATQIGDPGGFQPARVTANGAAVIPSQFGGTKALRPFLNDVSGVFPDVGASFHGIVDVIGGPPPSGFANVRVFLMSRYPGDLILELPGAPKDYGVTNVIVTAPTALGCPAGTTEVP
ncbi:MAG: hypothetical protein ACRD3T_21630, partial [Terriglobia bacterium]